MQGEQNRPMCQSNPWAPFAISDPYIKNGQALGFSALQLSPRSNDMHRYDRSPNTGYYHGSEPTTQIYFIIAVYN